MNSNLPKDLKVFTNTAKELTERNGRKKGIFPNLLILLLFSSDFFRDNFALIRVKSRSEVGEVWLALLAVGD